MALSSSPAAKENHLSHVPCAGICYKDAYAMDEKSTLTLKVQSQKGEVLRVQEVHEVEAMGIY